MKNCKNCKEIKECSIWICTKNWNIDSDFCSKWSNNNNLFNYKTTIKIGKFENCTTFDNLREMFNADLIVDVEGNVMKDRSGFYDMRKNNKINLLIVKKRE